MQKDLPAKGYTEQVTSFCMLKNTKRVQVKVYVEKCIGGCATENIKDKLKLL